MEALASDERRTGPTVEERLFDAGHRFDFYQAVKLLEILAPERVPAGDGVEPADEVVRFRSRTGFEFPTSDVARIEPLALCGCGRTMAMLVNFMGLAGHQGPLPDWVNELIQVRVGRQDTALRDFLDLFNHRLISLLLRARKKNRPTLFTGPPHECRSAGVAFALLGLGTPGLRHRMDLPERGLLSYTGLLAPNARTLVGLRQIIAGYFGVGAEINPFRGGWFGLDDDQFTRIGVTGQHQWLGHDASLGIRFFDQQARFELHLGPMDLEQFLDFLPTGRSFRELVALVHLYVGEDLDFSLRLCLKAAEVPELRLGMAGEVKLGSNARLAERAPVTIPGAVDPLPRLGRAGGSRLAYTSWLKTRPFTHDDSQVVLRISRDSVGGPRCKSISAS